MEKQNKQLSEREWLKILVKERGEYIEKIIRLQMKHKQAVKEAYEELCKEMIEYPNMKPECFDRISQLEIKQVFKDKFGFELE